MYDAFVTHLHTTSEESVIAAFEVVPTTRHCGSQIVQNLGEHKGYAPTLSLVAVDRQRTAVARSCPAVFRRGGLNSKARSTDAWRGLGV